MSNKRRFDNKHRILQKGEYQKPNGMYEFKWTDAYGKRHSVYSTDLDELRIKEQKIELNKFEGIKEAPTTLTVENLYETWKKLKRGIKATTLSNYVCSLAPISVIKRHELHSRKMKCLETLGTTSTTISTTNSYRFLPKN